MEVLILIHLSNKVDFFLKEKYSLIHMVFHPYLLPDAVHRPAQGLAELQR
jgi:hypothetical protein